MEVLAQTAPFTVANEGNINSETVYPIIQMFVFDVAISLFFASAQFTFSKLFKNKHLSFASISFPSSKSELR